MNKVFLKFFDEKRMIREFTGSSLGEIVNNAGKQPAYFRGEQYPGGHFVGSDSGWINTGWSIERHGGGGCYNVTDPKGEKRFVPRDAYKDTGGADFILFLITYNLSWSDFDQRKDISKELRVPFVKYKH